MSDAADNATSRTDDADQPAGDIPRTCPRCGGRLKRIVYGMPVPDLVNDNDVELGGCVITVDSPELRCGTCGLGVGGLLSGGSE